MYLQSLQQSAAHLFFQYGIPLLSSKASCYASAMLPPPTYFLKPLSLFIMFLPLKKTCPLIKRTLFTSSLTIKISLIFQDYLKKQYYQGNFSDTIKSYLFFPLMPFLVILNCKRQ